MAATTVNIIGGTAGAEQLIGTSTNKLTVTSASTDGTTGDTVDVVYSDFAAGDLIDKSALAASMADGGYYEGAITNMTATTEYSMVVITDQSYASNTDVETAIDTKLTDSVATDQIFVYLDSALGYAVAVYDSDMDSAAGTANGAGSLNQIVAFTGITTLAQLAAAFGDTGTSFI